MLEKLGEKELSGPEAKRLLCLRRIEKILNTTEDLKEPMRLALEMAKEVIGGDNGSIMLIDRDGKLRIYASTGIKKGIVAEINRVGISLGEGVAGWVAEKKEPLLLIGRDDPRFKEVMKRDNIIMALSVPIMGNQKIIGVLNVNVTSPGKIFTTDDLETLSNVAEDLYYAIGKRRNLEAMLEASSILHKARGLEETYRAMEEARILMGIERMVVFLVDEKNKVLVGTFDTKREKAIKKVKLPLIPELKERSPLVKAVLEKKTCVASLEEIEAGKYSFTIQERANYGLYPEFQTRPLAAIPMITESNGQDKVIGVIAVGSQPGVPVSAEEITVMETFASTAALAIEKAHSEEKLKDAYMEMVYALVEALEAKDHYTKGHSERVTILVVAIARKMGLPEERIKILARSGILHDVGKIAIPLEILHKLEKLTAKEWESIRQHPKEGNQIVGQIKEFSKVARFILHHHERLDGRGYPERISEEELFLEEKILILADCFDAMNSKRSYRKAMPIEDVVFELIRCSGSQFDPEVIKAFIAVLKEGIKVKENGTIKLIKLGKPEIKKIAYLLKMRAKQDASSKRRDEIELKIAYEFATEFVL